MILFIFTSIVFVLLRALKHFLKNSNSTAKCLFRNHGPGYSRGFIVMIFSVELYFYQKYTQIFLTVCCVD